MIASRFLNLLATSMLLFAAGCGSSADSQLQSLAANVENQLQSLNKATGRTQSTYSRVEYAVAGDSGTLTFTNNTKIDLSHLGGPVAEVPIEWRAQYKYDAGKWVFVSSERQIYNMSTGQSTWSPADIRAEGNAEVLAILRSAN